MGKFLPGHEKRGGRKAGVQNRVTRAFKDATLRVYQAIGGDQAYATWAKKHPGQFYSIASKLIPTEAASHGGRADSDIPTDPVEIARRLLFVMRLADKAEKVVAELPAPSNPQVEEAEIVEAKWAAG